MAGVCAVLLAAMLSGCGSYVRAVRELSAKDVSTAGAPSGRADASPAKGSASQTPGGPKASPAGRPTKAPAAGMQALPFDPDEFYLIEDGDSLALDLSAPFAQQQQRPARPPATGKSGKYLKVNSQPYLTQEHASARITGYKWPQYEDGKRAEVFLCRPEEPPECENAEQSFFWLSEEEEEFEFSMPYEEGLYELRLTETQYESDPPKRKVVDVATLSVLYLRDTANTVSVDKASYKPGEKIRVHFTASDRTADRSGWTIGIFRPGAGPNNAEDTEYLSEDIGDTLTLDAPDERGAFEVRMYAAYQDWDAWAARAAFTVEKPYVLDAETPAFLAKKDVSDWAFTEVNTARTAGLAPGTLCANLQREMTRGEFAQLCASAAGRLKRSSIALEPPPDADRAVTREEAAVMLQRTLTVATYGFVPDCPVRFREEHEDAFGASAWARDAVLHFASSGAFPGDSADPRGSLTREEGIVFACRAVRGVTGDPFTRYYVSRPEKSLDSLLLGDWMLTSLSGSLYNSYGVYQTWSGMGATYSFQENGEFSLILLMQGSIVGRSSVVRTGKYRVAEPGKASITGVKVSSNNNGLLTETSGKDDLLHYIVGEDEYGVFLLERSEDSDLLLRSESAKYRRTE